MVFCFENTKKDIIMTQEEKAAFDTIFVCRFCEKEVISDTVRNHGYLTGKNRGPAHRKCEINISQKQRTFIPFVFHIFSKYDCHLLLKKLVA